MKHRIYNGEDLQFFDTGNNLTATLQGGDTFNFATLNGTITVSGSNPVVTMSSGVSNISFGSSKMAIDINLEGGGAITSKGKTLYIGKKGDTVNLDVPGVSYLMPSTFLAKDLEAATLKLSNLPTSDPGTAGSLWNDSGAIKISS